MAEIPDKGKTVEADQMMVVTVTERRNTTEEETAGTTLGVEAETLEVKIEVEILVAVAEAENHDLIEAIALLKAQVGAEVAVEITKGSREIITPEDEANHATAETGFDKLQSLHLSHG